MKVYLTSKLSTSLNWRMTECLILVSDIHYSWIYTSGNCTLFISGFIWLREKWQLQWWFITCNSQDSSCYWKLCFIHQSLADCCSTLVILTIQSIDFVVVDIFLHCISVFLLSYHGALVKITPDCVSLNMRKFQIIMTIHLIM